MPMSNTRHAFPRTRGDASLYVRPLPALVRGGDATDIEDFLREVCAMFKLKIGITGYGSHPPPFTKTVQIAIQRLLGKHGIDISLKDIRVQRGMTHTKSCVVAIRMAKRFATTHRRTRRHLDWLPFLTVFLAEDDIRFSGYVSPNTNDYLKSDEAVEQLRDILMSHFFKSTGFRLRDSTVDHHVITNHLNTITDPELIQNECHELYQEYVGGHYLRQRVSYVCRQMSVTPHAWRGSRFVHSYHGESREATAFMCRMRELNDLVTYNIIQLHKLDGWPPLDLVADYFGSQCSRLEKLLNSCKVSMERGHRALIEGDMSRLECQLSDGPRAEDIINAVEYYAAMRDKGLKIKEILNNAQEACEDSGACLWTHH